jgi:hypothetical protein
MLWTRSVLSKVKHSCEKIMDVPLRGQPIRGLWFVRFFFGEVDGECLEVLWSYER